MPELAVQPHLINSIMVLLHTTIKAAPPPFPFPLSSFCFRTWQRAVLWLRQRWSHAARGTQRQSKARREQHHSLLSGGNKHTYIQISFVLLFLCNYGAHVGWSQNKSKARLQQVKHNGIKFTYISASNETSERKLRVSRESLCLHACLLPSLLLCTFRLGIFFFPYF